MPLHNIENLPPALCLQVRSSVRASKLSWSQEVETGSLTASEGAGSICKQSTPKCAPKERVRPQAAHEYGLKLSEDERRDDKGLTSRSVIHILKVQAQAKSNQPCPFLVLLLFWVPAKPKSCVSVPHGKVPLQGATINQPRRSLAPAAQS